MSSVRVRFAPSPTGFLHIGGARTALFNWLFARAQKGQFLLRIEDTDKERSEDRYTADILESLRWLGMDWDEEPVYQSRRIERHKEVVQELLNKGMAYHCDCTTEMLEKAREKAVAEKRPYRYEWTCRNKAPGSIQGPSVVRIKNPTDGETSFEDLIRGRITIPNKEIDDWIILRSDGNPTYNFVVTVDDHDQGVTHVLRGEDHINNTPKQMLINVALGWEVPRYGHLPMIFGSDRAKLSKRHGAASTLEYRKMGYLPEALVNFLVRLGWSHGDDEVFSVEQLKQIFSIETIGKSGAIFNAEKLDWVSGQHLKDYPTAKLLAYLRKYFSAEIEFLATENEQVVLEGVALLQGKVKTCLELIAQLDVLFGKDPGYDLAVLKDKQKEDFGRVLPKVAADLGQADFSKQGLETFLKQWAEKSGEKFGAIAQSVRFGVTGGRVSPELYDMLYLMGRERVLRRVQSAVKAF